ncbi:MAG: hypothetical protein HQL46_13515 [Gammaproteobacteria bacterium]|nr:hypothetical protein [Gammaproteobacteria bacterium]
MVLSLKNSAAPETCFKPRATSATSAKALGLIKARFNQFEPDYSAYENNTIVDVPNATAAIGGKYQLTNNYYVQGDIKYTGERFYNIANTAKLNPYTLVNVALGYQRHGWKGLLYINNLADKQYIDFMIYTPDNNYYHFGAPREIGVQLSKTF